MRYHYDSVHRMVYLMIGNECVDRMTIDYYEALFGGRAAAHLIVVEYLSTH